TICIGQAASMAAVLLCAGTKGKRLSLPNSRILIHQPIGGVQGQATDIEIHAREIVKIRNVLNRIISRHTGMDISKVEKDTERDYFMNAEEALSYRIIDSIYTTRKTSK
ncbi:MAG: ATP-dependent Clp protease proteolytic subunit, partial [Deltaproteobacteria bacterium]|nr:ATP-dependent Clp protease proteolytic subunit [Deltaproteobacteria bacterium]